MNAAPVLLGYTAVVGFVAPPLLLRAGWPHRAPALATAVWHTLMVAFAIGVALSAYNLAMPTEHLHAGLVGLLHACGVDLEAGRSGHDIAHGLAVALPTVVGIALVASFSFHAVRARRARARHREALDLVGRHTVKQMYDAGRKVSKSDMQPGDIIYWYNDNQHNGMYVGDGKAIHAPRTGKNIEIVPVDSMPFFAASRP